MKHHVIFAYPQALSFSGQTAATLLALDEVRATGRTCTAVEFVALDRSQSKPRALLAYFIGLLWAWGSTFFAATRWSSILCFNHGQSMSSFVRMGIPHLILRGLSKKRPIVASIHGNAFLKWEKSDLKWRFMRKIMMASDIVTVLGDAQRAGIADMGLRDSQIVTVPNSVDVPICSESVVDNKHQGVAAKSAPFRLLHLSLLIESKGYTTFLEAARLAALRTPAQEFEVVLCGPMAFTSYCKRFIDEATKAAWIDAKLEELNLVPNIDAVWIRGAKGAAKDALLLDAHCFVFPTRFPVEAQPLVLIEAMASGCAIVASDQGEISSTVPQDAGFILPDVAPEKVADAITEVVMDFEKRLGMARAARKTAANKFSTDKYRENWNELLMSLETNRS